jgi:hypothetical protein
MSESSFFAGFGPTLVGCFWVVTDKKSSHIGLNSVEISRIGNVCMVVYNHDTTVSSVERVCNMELINLLDKDGATIIDSVPSAYEDSFSLESFGELVRSYWAAKSSKAFIIARIRTIDEKYPGKVSNLILGVLQLL